MTKQLPCPRAGRWLGRGRRAYIPLRTQRTEATMRTVKPWPHVAAGLLLCGVGALLGAHSTARRATGRAAQIEVTWLGHAAFLIVSPGGTRLLIDPWLKGNLATPDSLQDLSRYRPNFILVTHSHFDHVSDAKAIAPASGAPVAGAFDWVSSLGLPQTQQLGGNVGGTIEAEDVTIRLVVAMHGSVPH